MSKVISMPRGKSLVAKCWPLSVLAAAWFSWENVFFIQRTIIPPSETFKAACVWYQALMHPAKTSSKVKTVFPSVIRSAVWVCSRPVASRRDHTGGSCNIIIRLTSDVKSTYSLPLLLPLTRLIFSTFLLFILHFPISLLSLNPHLFFRFAVLFQLSWAVTQNKMRNQESSLSAVPTDSRIVVCACV